MVLYLINDYTLDVLILIRKCINYMHLKRILKIKNNILLCIDMDILINYQIGKCS